MILKEHLSFCNLKIKMNNSLYENKFISFLKRYNLYDETIYNYLINNAIMVDIKEYIDFIGCFFVKNEYDCITKVTLCIPFLEDDITTLITIHEYVHGYTMFKKIGKKYQLKASEEVLPMLYEELYFLENQSPKLLNHRKNTLSYIKGVAPFKYKLGYAMQKELLLVNNKDITHLNSLVPHMCKKYIYSLKHGFKL